MKRIQRIMVACDLSEYSEQGLKYAVVLAENLNARLLIVNLINQRDVVAVTESILAIPVLIAMDPLFN